MCGRGKDRATRSHRLGAREGRAPPVTSRAAKGWFGLRPTWTSIVAQGGASAPRLVHELAGKSPADSGWHETALFRW